MVKAARWPNMLSIQNSSYRRNFAQTTARRTPIDGGSPLFARSARTKMAIQFGSQQGRQVQGGCSFGQLQAPPRWQHLTHRISHNKKTLKAFSPLRFFYRCTCHAGTFAFSAISSNMAVVKDLGRSMGCPRARDQIMFADTPKIRLTPNITV